MKRDATFLIGNTGAVFIPGVKGFLKMLTFAKKDVTTEAVVEMQSGTAVLPVAIPPVQLISGAVSINQILQVNIGLAQMGFFQIPLNVPIDFQTAIALAVTGPTDLSDFMLTVEVS